MYPSKDFFKAANTNTIKNKNRWPPRNSHLSTSVHLWLYLSERLVYPITKMTCTYQLRKKIPFKNVLFFFLVIWINGSFGPNSISRVFAQRIWHDRRYSSWQVIIVLHFFSFKSFNMLISINCNKFFLRRDLCLHRFKFKLLNIVKKKKITFNMTVIFD